MLYWVLANRSAFRFLWRELGLLAPPDSYEMNFPIFGPISTPAVYSFALRQAAKDFDDHAENVLKEVVDLRHRRRSD